MSGMASDLQCTKSKNTHEQDLLLERQEQFRKYRHRNCQEHHIAKDIEGSVEEPEEFVRYAFRLDRHVPEARNWYTGQCGHKYGLESVQDDEDHYRNCPFASWS